VITTQPLAVRTAVTTGEFDRAALAAANWIVPDLLDTRSVCEGVTLSSRLTSEFNWHSYYGLLVQNIAG
jgi:hypothetical protein